MSGASEFMYESLACRVCREDVLGEALGNCVWAENFDEVELPRFVDVHWVCRGECDKLIQASLNVQNYSAPWVSIKELTNPLIYKEWAEVTPRRIERGDYSEIAASKISKLLRTIAPISNREPTEQDIAEYRLLRELNGL